MIARNYTAHAYCDGDHQAYDRPDIEAIAETWRGAQGVMKRAGWSVREEDGTEKAYCPACTKRLPAPPAADRGGE